jgi:four helix bundle protein
VTTARRLEDLDVWLLSVELRDEIIRLTNSGRCARDVEFCDQIRDACSSPPRNIAEGFGRFKPKPFANFLRIARGSLLETRNHLNDARTRGYFSHEDTMRLLSLQRRTTAGVTKLIRYLESCRGDPPYPPTDPPEPDA